jgi:quercetin dioxygenase-like cupin family protein
MTVVIAYPPGAPPHRHPGPAFGFVLEGEMLWRWRASPCSVRFTGC